MPIATKISTGAPELHDAPHGPRATPATREDAASEPPARQTDVLDADLDDAYDNVACTD